MKYYGWTSEYVAAIEEHDRTELQRRISVVRKLIAERFASLVESSMTGAEYEEFGRLRDARRALDLLERVSNDGELFQTEDWPQSA